MEKEKIWLSSPHLSGHEEKYIQEALATNWVAPLGPNVNGFEEELQSYLGSVSVSALVSGTSAIHLALILLGVKANDEVICQSFTFSASANPILYQGAVPIFVDSENDTWNLDPELLQRAIEDRIAKGKKPKAIIVVHLYGMPAKMDEIISIAKKYEIAVVEDAAEALGSRYKKQACGTFGKMSILSFNGNKIITSSGGGALISRDKKMIERSKFLATQARDDAPHYQHTNVGYNYRMSNIVAGVGRGQLEVIDKRVSQRRAVNKFYRELLKGFDGIEFLTEMNTDYFSNHWLTAMTLDQKKLHKNGSDLRLAFEVENIESRPLWKPMHLQPIFKDYPAYVNGVCEALFDKGLCVPSGSNLKEDDLDRIARVLLDFFNKK